MTVVPIIELIDDFKHYLLPLEVFIKLFLVFIIGVISIIHKITINVLSHSKF